ncbi:GntR family transcriptional regulator [Pseudorhodoplanes sinuspersici]|uniref:GntR family transcriptional regulator n=1 Tax=Pseudorhodoplanes sinuspersici TaxID=1235591 RepID=A0A1W6ZYX0_9HYPH|nr:GntR family transcriptional regulator [Pseudorhodoplanes sinuspersici]ARQ02468.1 GntR family transcriptional regulator [Pseudorhodoplanes sinuspersici]RKE74306.1 GntR family transcriptional regulator [Pseudorhodoplanes sinuspersici]
MDLKVSPVSVQQQAASKLRAAILAGVFQPGERLVEADLCERLGVSRPSVREALRSLEAEKLVAIVPNRGPLVPLITWEQAREIYQVRVLLEAEAAAACAQSLTPDSIRRMQDALADFIKADKEDNAVERVNATSRFYDEILNGCGNSVIKDILNGLLARVTFLRSRTMSAPGRAKHSAQEMAAMLQAIQKRDSDAARKAAAQHVERASRAAQAIFEKQ